MNLTAASLQGQPKSVDESRERGARGGAQFLTQQGEAFERALRAKTEPGADARHRAVADAISRTDEGADAWRPVTAGIPAKVELRVRARLQDDDAAGDTPAAAASALAVAAVTPQTARPTEPAAGPVSVAIETVATGPRAAIEAALNSSPGPIVSPIGGTEPAAVWEASVSEPNSIAVEVRAMRAEQPAAQQVQPGWMVAVTSSTVNADILSRHAPRLTERLRKQALGITDVRVEQDLQDAEEDDR